jgi:DNA polymerase V
MSFASPVEEELADTISIGEYLLRNKDQSFLLEMVGDSMKESGILHGDMIIFERTSDCKAGDIVVALTEDGYTLKHLKNGERSHVIGVVTSSFRRYKV